MYRSDCDGLRWWDDGSFAFSDAHSYSTNDVARTGQNLNETILTTANVNSTTFGKLRSLPVDGKVDAQPLYLSGQKNIAGGIHNVLYVATEHDSVYAFDADTGTQLWKVSLLGSGEATSDVRGCDQVVPEIGITATPVIDRTAGANGVIYVVAMSKSGSTYFQRLHALDVTTGAEVFGGPKNIQATFPGTGDNSSNGNVVFDPAQYEGAHRAAPAERSAVHNLGLTLRYPPLHRLDNGIQPDDSGADQRAEYCPQRQRRRDLDG
jgi:outer membrane protein assembly factor BamB